MSPLGRVAHTLARLIYLRHVCGQVSPDEDSLYALDG